VYIGSETASLKLSITGSMRLEKGAVMSCRIETGTCDSRLPAYASAERKDVGGGMSVD
jgi:hypothetical protein